MNETNLSRFKKRAAALAVASCVSFAPWVAEAAGIGKLTVLSGLGQPLWAELDVAATRDELAGMTARLAPQEAFRQAGIDYASVLLDLRFTLDKRPNGQSVVKVTSVRPVNEPFLDFLVELNWSAGRLVREYTFLLDPPSIAAKQAARSVAEARVVETVQGGGGQERAEQSRVAPRSSAASKVTEEAKTDASRTRLVAQGDTLRKIAGETRYEGVSLEQMLVGLYRNNPDAFIGKNINRLKAGAILGLPEKAAVEAVSEAEAKKFYVTQAGDWNAYRQKLAATTAAAPAKEAASSQSSSGKVAARVEEKVVPAEVAKDQVKVSSTEMPAKGAATGKGAAAEADQVAREKALKEAQDRLALLEKNVSELQKLVEMKNQKLAELQQQSAAKKDESKPVEPAKPAEPAKAVDEVKPVELPKPVVAEKPVEVAPVELPKPVQPKPVKAALPPPVPEPAPEPGIVDSLLEDPLPLAGGGGILALLAAYFLIKRRRSQMASVETTAAPGPSSLGPNSVFRMTGGQSIDTGNTPPQTGDFSQTGPGTIDTDEVDPVAEADVYMAYGRDAQAEEILLEALQKDPQRTAIHAKLLEIYASRGSLKQFETLASELYAQTGGVGVEWEKVSALGASLDPANPLYSGAQLSAPAFDADATMIVSAEAIAKARQTEPEPLEPLVELVSVAAVESEVAEFDMDALELPEPSTPMVDKIEAESVADLADEVMSLDFDLGSPEPEVEAKPELLVVDEPYFQSASASDSDNALDFDLGNEEPIKVDDELLPGELDLTDELVAEDVDFDLNIPATQLPAEPADADPDFSPEGTLVMPSFVDEGVSTFIGFDSAPDSPFVEEPPAPDDEVMVDFDLDVNLPEPELANDVGQLPDDSATETLVDTNALREAMDFDNPELVETVVNPGVIDDDSLEFDVKLTDSVFLGQPIEPPDFDIGAINLDLAADTGTAEAVAEADVSPSPAEISPSSPPVDPAHWEEVNTKLDLAKAYEEMGDLEGARELLEEVLGEGPVDLVEQAKAILDRIGE